MALSKAARNKLQRLVQQSKKLLIQEITDQLQQYYGIRPDGEVLMVEQLTSNDADVIHKANLLRQRLEYITENIPDKEVRQKEAVNQLIREQAFTILNRLAALRMAEERGIIQESIRKGYSSEGFEVFDSVTGQGQTAEIFIRYKWYIYAVFDELALDLPSMFDRFSPYAILFPAEKALMGLLSLINDEEITIHREEGQPPINLWKEDETIGWIYQYYNSREEISAMRDASSTPRNSRELAVRNQFFTPRYVVQFLTDNSLGRIWYEMTQGNTRLKEVCPYLIIRPQEVFLIKGETKPEHTDEETVYIEYRKIKDPREIKLLDPACGSMHFGLYAFDVFEHIYQEAWDHYPELLTDLRNSMTRQDFIMQIPELIIRHNIHGVDIDPRALQIAALSLWLRAQKSFEKLRLQAAERPQITKSNLVLAEAMPGNVELLSKVVKPLDAPMRKLVLHIWELMKMAGETGLLLRIEKEIDQKIQEIAEELKDAAKNTQLQLDNEEAKQKAAKDAARYATKQYRDEFLEKAETQVLDILKLLAEKATNGDAYQKLLFADDSARGFAFIDLCRQEYEVVVMNPPFGLGVKKNFNKLKEEYPDGYVDLLAAFVLRAYELSISFIGAITSRNILVTPKLARVRKRILIPQMFTLLDLGLAVMDNALVESSAYLLSKGNLPKNLHVIDCKKYPIKEEYLDQLSKIHHGNEDIFNVERKIFHLIPGNKILYNLPQSISNLFQNGRRFKDSLAIAKQGMKSFDDNRFVRLRYEVNPNDIGRNKKWCSYSKGGQYSLFYLDLPVLIKYKDNGKEVQEVNRLRNGQTAQARQASTYYYLAGGNYSRRSSKGFGVRILPKDFVIGEKGPIIIPKKGNNELFITGILNSKFYNFLVSIQANAKQYDTGIIENLPYIPITKFNQSIIEIAAQDAVIALQELNTYLEESSLFFSPIWAESIKKMYLFYKSKVENCRNTVQNSLSKINNIIDEELKIDSSKFQLLAKEFSDEDNDDSSSINDSLNSLFPLKSIKTLAEDLISYLIGCLFERWDLNMFGAEQMRIDKDNLFKNYTGNVPGYKTERSTIKCYFITTSDSSELPNNNLSAKIESLIYSIWGNGGDRIIFELLAILKVSRLNDYIHNPNEFFANHLKKYSHSRRESPIYWPLSTSSGNLIIWLYYHDLNEQSLFQIVNDCINPLKEKIREQIQAVESKHHLKDNNLQKEIHHEKEYLHELEDFENELLRIANLPYKPNHDDGVLITASPLHKLFRHSKWRKSTEDCWKKLEKGEFDWAHLAYSIWPERVRKKCVKDLSMAIAHGLESICEVKPKEKKGSQKKAPKEIKKDAQMKIGE